MKQHLKTKVLCWSVLWSLSALVCSFVTDLGIRAFWFLFVVKVALTNPVRVESNKTSDPIG